MKLRIPALLPCLAFALTLQPSLQADVVTDWNATFESTLQNPSERGPRVPNRHWAIMHAAMFDAVNGIERSHQPLFVTQAPPPGARSEAAAIQAAYRVLSTLRPTYQAVFDAQLAASLAQVAGSPGNSESIARGREWGETVALAILTWRANDGSSTVLPPFVGSTAAGFWRHAPLGAAATAGYANLVTVPFILPNQLVCDPGPPFGHADRAAAMASALYAADVNEVMTIGGTVSAVRTAAQEDHARFNNACDVATFNRLLRSLVSPNAKLVDNARCFALLNLTSFDAGVMFFRAKYQYALWRPFQAINYANEAGNPAIVQNGTWTSLLPTPSHPEYPSAHVTLFSSMVQVITRLVGDTRPIELTAPGFAPRVYPNLAAIITASIDGRVMLGFHFRDTGEVSEVMGRAIGDYAVDHGLVPKR
jgi:hypothetical protein